MRLSSSTFELLDGALFGAADVDAALDDDALVAAMLQAETALVAAAAELGLIPAEAAQAIAQACGALKVDRGELVKGAATAGNPVPALVRQLGAAVPESARPWVHFGATSQDILDTALMLVAKRATGAIAAHLDACGDACAALAEQHRDTVMIGRTLGQQASPTTFGRKAAGWLLAFDEAGDAIDALRRTRLAVQLGGAVGTLAAFGSDGDAVVANFAERLDLCVPILPWHTDRSRMLDVAGALGQAGAAAAKTATDVVLLAETEVAEVSLDQTGESSAMPHKRNPVAAVLIRAAGRRLPGLLATVLAAAEQEHERGTAGWHAEWAPLLELLRLVGGTSQRMAQLLAGLSVDAERMRSNLDHGGGLAMAEALAHQLAPLLGRSAAHDLVARCVDTAVETGIPFSSAVFQDPVISTRLTRDEVLAALSPQSWLGTAGAMVDRAVAAHRRRRG